MDSKKEFLVVIDQEHTRNIQIASIPEADRCDTENWYDYQGSVVAGTFHALTKDEAIGEAAVHVGVSGEVLTAYEIVRG